MCNTHALLLGPLPSSKPCQLSINSTSTLTPNYLSFTVANVTRACLCQSPGLNTGTGQPLLTYT